MTLWQPPLLQTWGGEQSIPLPLAGDERRLLHSAFDFPGGGGGGSDRGSKGGGSSLNARGMHKESGFVSCLLAISLTFREGDVLQPSLTLDKRGALVPNRSGKR